MIFLSSGCKYHSYQSIVNMKLEEYQRPELQFASKVLSFMAYCSITFIVMDTMLPLELLQILACPACKGILIQIEDGSSLQCKPCNRNYPIVDGIPVLIPAQTDSALRTRCEAT
jgi:uncharacterized protein YbaR (Trm112 family)